MRFNGLKFTLPDATFYNKSLFKEIINLNYVWTLYFYETHMTFNIFF